MVEKYKKESNISYTLGATITFELLLQKPKEVLRVYINNKTSAEIKEKLLDICLKNNIELCLNEKIFRIFSDKENFYVIGVFQKFYSKSFSDFPHLVLVNPSNGGNLGTIIRSAVGFNFNNLAIITPSADIFEPKTIRASMGSIFHMNIKFYKNFFEYEEEFKDYMFYPFMINGKKELNTIQRVQDKKYSLIFGNEATGLPDEFLEIGEAIVIKHSKAIDSLNLPIAVSLALYEFSK